MFTSKKRFCALQDTLGSTIADNIEMTSQNHRLQCLIAELREDIKDKDNQIRYLGSTIKSQGRINKTLSNKLEDVRKAIR